MSGHSHWATTHRQKEINAAKRGNLFSKLSRAISIAVKSGGVNIDANLKLRVAVDKARVASMPKENIDRAISRAVGGETLEEITYEGFGPNGIGVIVEAATDNRNRTAQEIKNIFEKGGGSLAGPNSVAFNFENKGFLVVKKTANPDAAMLAFIDAGAEDIEETSDSFVLYLPLDKLSEVKAKLSSQSFEIFSIELTLKPKNLIRILDVQSASKILSFLASFEEHDDVQKVYSNADIPESLFE